MKFILLLVLLSKISFILNEDKSITIPGTPSYIERQLQELLQTPPKKRKAVVKKYRGLNLDGGGTPAQSFEFYVSTILHKTYIISYDS